MDGKKTTKIKRVGMQPAGSALVVSRIYRMFGRCSWIVTILKDAAVAGQVDKLIESAEILRSTPVPPKVTTDSVT